jgi:hypothetical protein
MTASSLSPEAHRDVARGPTLRFVTKRILPVVFVASLFVISGVAGALAPSSAVASPASSHGTAGLRLSLPAPASAPRAGSGGGGNNSTYIENGTGFFFNNTAPANVTGSFPGCAQQTYSYIFGNYTEKSCWNATADPSLNVTTDGYTGLATTIWTNDSPCPAMRNNDSTTEIEFTNSTDFGSTWGTPEVLGNPVCAADSANDQNYSDAEMPGLTSLSNGTFVLTYVESNVSASSYDYYYASYPGSLECGYMAHDRIVVTESYDHGATWTTPQVLQQTDILYPGCDDPGMPFLRPSIAATGNTVYVAWTEYPAYFPEGYEPYEGYLHLAVSTNGGAAWSNASVPPTINGSFTYPPYNVTVAAFPNLLVDPNGTLYISYATGFNDTFVCATYYCGDVDNSSIVVAWSNDNGSSFGHTVVTPYANLSDPYALEWGPQLTGPYSQLAYSAFTGETYLIYESGTPGEYCYELSFIFPIKECGFQSLQSDVMYTDSANGGSTWATPVSIDPGFVNPDDGWANSAYNPSIAVRPNGDVDVTYSVTNASICQPTSFIIIFFSECGANQQAFTLSTDGGATWAPPGLVDPVYAYTQDPLAYDGSEMYMGTGSAILAAGSQVLLAWANITDSTGFFAEANWGYEGSLNVETSRLYTGTGITVDFTEAGLPAGTIWNLTVGGYYRDGPTGATFALSGVPPSYSLGYTVGWLNTSYGVAWQPAGAPASPVSFSKNSSVVITYSELVLLQVATLPNVQSYYWLDGYTNYAISPLVGSTWEPVGVPLTLSVTPVTPLYCYPCLNFTFLAWQGSGSGSYTGNSPSVLITPATPVNETASFTLNGFCDSGRIPYCANFTYTQSFQESGLPAGTPWGVTLQNPNATITTVTGSAALLTTGVSTSGGTNWSAWTVPSATPGEYWVPSSSDPTEFVAPFPLVSVNYTLRAIASTFVDSWVEETGLPNGTAWQFQIGSDDEGTTSATSGFATYAGSSIVLNASPVYFEDGIGYYVRSVTVDPFVSNSTSYSIVPGASTTLDGPFLVVYQYAPEFLLTVSSGAGGTVSAASQWVPNGSSIDLSAAPSPGYHFVAWAGTGPGSSSSGTASTITVAPSGPVTEVATFRANFPPTWNVTLTSSGLPAGTPFTIVVGGTTYSGFGSIRIGNLSGGFYSVGTPTISANSTNTTQFVPSSLTSTAGLSNGVLDLTENVTLTVSYVTQYAISIIATAGGSIPGYANGTYWENASSTVHLLAVPDPGYLFSSWSGTVDSTAVAIAVTITGGGNETAQFLAKPVLPPTVFTLTATETGLPAGTAWQLVVGTTGGSGSSVDLLVGGLNGSYLVTAPTVFPSAGVRWVSNVTNLSIPISANRTLAVGYWEQFQVTVAATAGGSASVGSDWVNASGTLTLSATPNATSVFVGWNGTGIGSYNGTDPNPTLTVFGPISEQATFAPSSSGGSTPGSGPSGSSGEVTAVIILVALLLAGLAVGLLLGRRQPPAAESPAPEGPAPADSEPTTAADVTPEPRPLAPYDEGPPYG